MRRETACTAEQAEGRNAPQYIVGHDRRRVANLFVVDHVRTGGDVTKALLCPRRRHGDGFEQARGLQHDLELSRLGDRLCLFREAAGADHEGRAFRDAASQLEATVGSGHRMLLNARRRLDEDCRAGHHQAARVAYDPFHGPLPLSSNGEHEAEKKDEHFLHSGEILARPGVLLPGRPARPMLTQEGGVRAAGVKLEPCVF
jgi:hypothetical protein